MIMDIGDLSESLPSLDSVRFCSIDLFYFFEGQTMRRTRRKRHQGADASVLCPKSGKLAHQPIGNLTDRRGDMAHRKRRERANYRCLMQSSSLV